ncbi:MAG: acyl--CoA ligase [Candidatus Lokiarchaeota archaeon]|nr:acyl--CoA ligase [Candidatus Lokiarchaeota archaeon]
MSYEEFNKVSHYLNEHVSRHARERPDDYAIIDADDGRFITWKDFETAINMIALKLLDMGFEKGDIVISMLPLLPEHVFLEYACFKLGVIFAPLDSRLKEDELLKSIKLLQAKAKMFVHLDNTDTEDRYGKKTYYPFKDYAVLIHKNVPSIKYFMQFSPIEDAPRGWLSWLLFAKEARDAYYKHLQGGDLPRQLQRLADAASAVREDDPIFIIYTTGSTGFPKPAMLTNVGIVAQNFCMTKAFKMTRDDRMLVNLPPSHVGCQTEQLMTTLYAGGIAVILHAFFADKTMRAINEYKVTCFGQIPSLFVMEWRLPDYASYDISSLRFAIYGGQGVSKKFLERLSAMAPTFGTGLGLTEISGFCSYTPLEWKIEQIVQSVGIDYPICPLSIREPMDQDGTAGKELPDGEIGEICYTGPQVFKGYFGNEEATRKTISKEGVLYTGDLGFKDSMGLHLTGRAKFVIKPKGYQVFPPEIEAHVERVPEVAACAIVGAKHEVFSEGVVAFVQLRKAKDGKPVDQESIRKKINDHCKSLTSYKRPNFIVFLDEIPLNRVDKTDYKELYGIVDKYVEEERNKGGWDARKSAE